MHLHQMEGKVEKLLARPLTADTKFIVCGQRPTAKHKKLSSNALFVKNVGTKEPWSSGYLRKHNLNNSAQKFKSALIPKLNLHFKLPCPVRRVRKANGHGVF